MRRWIVVLWVFVIAQMVAIGFLALLLYQTTPNNVLARETVLAKIPGVLAITRVVDRSLNALYRGPTPAEALPHYSLEVDPSDLQAIEESLPEEIPSKWYGNLFLMDENKEWVKGTFVADGREYKVKVRVRGDLFNHWAYRKKSWRIKFKKDDLFRGMRAINLIIPEDRGWIAEPLNVYRAQKLGLLHPPTRFVTMSLNGSSPMIYTEIEHWGKEMLEKQGRPGDVNLYQAGGGSSTFDQWDAVFRDVAYWQKYETDTSSTDSYEEIELLQSLSRPGAHTQPDYVKKLNSIVDIDRTVGWYVLSLLSGSRHVLDHNMRLFFDTSRGRIEPIPWDTFLYYPRTLLSPPGNSFLNEVFSVPELKLRAYRRVWRYVVDDDQVEDDLDQAHLLRVSMEEAAYRDAVKLPSNRQVHAALDEKKKMLKANFDFLKEELKVSEVLVNQRLPSRDNQAKGIMLTIDITARGISPALLSGAKLPGYLRDDLENKKITFVRDDGDGVWTSRDHLIPFEFTQQLDKKERTTLSFVDSPHALLAPGAPVAANSRLEAPHTRHRFFLLGPQSLVPEELPLSLSIRNAVTGAKAQVVGEALIDERTFEGIEETYSDRAEFLQANQQFLADGDSGVVLKGTVTFTETVTVPTGVHFSVAPGTTVRLAEGVSLLVRGPVTADGTEGAPIIFRPLNDKKPWGVFAVLNAKQPSSVSFAEFWGGSEAYVHGTLITGMVAFHGSPVRITDSLFTEAHGDDGLNLKHVTVSLQRCVFAGNDFDGLDIDFAPAGEVLDSVFIDNGNDGLDISWSPLVIRDVQIEGSGDKCVSVGERSTPSIIQTTMKGCAIGLAVKDDSHATVEQSAFWENDIGIAAYIKKPIFSAPSASVINSTFVGNGEDTRAMSGATIVMDEVGE